MQPTQNSNANNKRIAKNTLLLYGRMLIMMLISLYTSRVIINALGIEDYGIYGVVGGVVSMFSIISGSLNAAISRFITFELGKGDKEKLKKVFCTAINVQILLIAIITILLETIGLWVINYKLVVPNERIIAVNWVFQFSILTFALNLICVPYSAAIIAHEKMSVFAYISIFDAVSKLVISYLILLNPFDRLVYYGLLLLVIGIIQRFIYTIYCTKHYEECHYHFVFDKIIIKEFFSFAGWNFIGASSVVLRDQGGNLLINLFFGPAVNAARSVAMSVNNAVMGFVTNFMTALNPQLTKSYAVGDYEYSLKLVFQGARFSFYILLLLALPVIFTAQYLLELWLGIVPEHATNFTRLVLIFTMSESLANPLVTLMLATGKIRNYQIYVGGIQLLNLPVSYLLFQFGYPPECVFVVAIVISIICEIVRLCMLKKMVGLSIRSFMKKVYLNVVVVSSASVVLPYIAVRFLGIDSSEHFFELCIISLLSTVSSIYFFGCDKRDKKLIKMFINRVLKKLK